LWLAVTIVVIAACRVASSADAGRSGPRPANLDPHAQRPTRGHRHLRLARRGAEDRPETGRRVA
jgi:hypothetical protein